MTVQVRLVITQVNSELIRMKPNSQIAETAYKIVYITLVILQVNLNKFILC